MAAALGVSAIGSIVYGSTPGYVTTTPAVTTAATGSVIVAGCGIFQTATEGAITDNKSNTYTQLGTTIAYPSYGTSGAKIAAKINADGGSGHTWTETIGATSEGTIIAVEVTGGTEIVSSTYGVARAPAGTNGSFTSNSVTTTGPAILICFLFAEGYFTADPTASGWTLQKNYNGTESSIQGSVFTREVTGAGTYSCTIATTGASQGAVVYIVAVQGVSGPQVGGNVTITSSAGVLVGANSAGASHVGGAQWESAGAVAYSGTTSVTPAYPTGIQSGDGLVLIVGMKPGTANSGTCTAPTGWTAVPNGSITGAGGYGSTLAADTGNTNLWSFTKDTVTGSESGALSVTVGTNNVCWAQIHRVSKERSNSTWSFAGATGSRTTAPTAGTPFTVTCGADPGVAAKDVLIGALCIPTDVTTPSQFSSESFAQTGITFGTTTEDAEPDSTTNNDIGGVICHAKATAGTSSAAPGLTMTAGGTVTNVRGPLLIVRIREVQAAVTSSGSGSDTAGVTVDAGMSGIPTASGSGSESTATVTDAGAGSMVVSGSGGDTAAVATDRGGTEFLAAGQSAVAYVEYGAGPDHATTADVTTKASGSIFVVAAGEWDPATDLRSAAAPTDSKGNTYVEQLSIAYPSYPNALAVAWTSATPATGGANHNWTKNCAAGSETTVIAVEVTDAQYVHDKSAVARNPAGASAAHTSGSVTTTGPAVLVCFILSDGFFTADPTASSWTLSANYNAVDNSIQASCFTRKVTSAGTYSCTIQTTTSGNYGASLLILALQRFPAGAGDETVASAVDAGSGAAIASASGSDAGTDATDSGTGVAISAGTGGDTAGSATDSGTGVAISAGTGGDTAAEATESGAGIFIPASSGSGTDAVSVVDAGSGVGLTFGSGTDTTPVVTDAGSGTVQSISGSGGDTASVVVDAGSATIPSSAGVGSDAASVVDAGSGASISASSGSDLVGVTVDAGTVVSPTASGTGSDTGPSVVDAGSATAPVAGSGSDTASVVDAGSATAQSFGSGSDTIVIIDAGFSGTPAASGTGGDNVSVVDAGTATTPSSAGSGSDSAGTQVDSGTGAVLAVGAGSDLVFQSIDAGTGSYPTVGGVGGDAALAVVDSGTASTPTLASGTDAITVVDVGSGSMIVVALGSDVANTVTDEGVASALTPISNATGADSITVVDFGTAGGILSSGSGGDECLPTNDNGEAFQIANCAGYDSVVIKDEGTGSMEVIGYGRDIVGAAIDAGYQTLFHAPYGRLTVTPRRDRLTVKPK